MVSTRWKKFLKKRGRGSKVQYLVKWLGYPNKYNSWVNASEIIVLNSWRCSCHVIRFTTMNTKFQKGDKGDMANAKMYTFLEQNIGGKTFLRLRK